MGAAVLALAGSGIASAGSAETLEIEGTFTSLTGAVQDKFVQNELLRVSKEQHPGLPFPTGATGLELTFRFDSFDVDIDSGGKLTWINKTNDGHTVTIVNEAALPTTVDSALKCVPFLPGGGAGICGETFAKHFPPNATPVPVIGGGNLKNRGDSLLIGPPGPSTVTATVTAAPGTTLFYMCIFHPEMQGVIKVERPD
jgi:plastocyanin